MEHGAWRGLCVYVCMYVCVYMYIYIYIYVVVVIYIYRYLHSSSPTHLYICANRATVVTEEAPMVWVYGYGFNRDVSIDMLVWILWVKYIC
jgi:hypothetical protein